ncbi:MAG: pyridoxamine 5'-phosphate oxidase family protein [Anaerolineae bacterium]|nr:pyridoxamine 5'-phosphate oxidase family protein [Anaerolineae bacterium]
MEVTDFSEIQEEFLRRVHSVVWCTMATLDTRNRPRSRILHPIWEGTTGWITTRRHSHKAKHLAHSPYVSLAYTADLAKPVYVDCVAEWVDDLDEKKRLWDLLLTTPPPLGFDPAPIYKSVDDSGFGLLKLTPWRIEVTNFPAGPHLIWRPK